MVCVWSVRPSGISPGGTRLIFDGSNDAATMSVNNGSAGTWLMRFWVSPYGEQACNATAKSDVKNGNVPFVITPPVVSFGTSGCRSVACEPGQRHTAGRSRISLLPQFSGHSAKEG
ncbi:fimbria/pilus periplasmic chaperone [Escherichia coli]|nr:fimbria/pilus periplasmic chaperone [Escherichia coli]